MRSLGQLVSGKSYGWVRFLLALRACALYNAARFVCEINLRTAGECGILFLSAL